ncbi:cysteine-rich VLP protein [Fictibacillus enclensis]|uniref:cysteine-rich VLP protein n=1 Tax=Fictibacillus enclensis TaxID=1017270 RepID=UPI00259FF991|nr:cysteine-rich VLP protein [Fictibacillus enclensis]MDM5197870.1 cysteine-rich VLP protein [Fictibacillus enclensis]
MNQRKLQSVKSKANKLAKDNCANYTGAGLCLVACGGRCLLTYESEGTGNICPYFIASVLPAEHELEMEYREIFDIPSVPLQKDLCDECGRPIERSSNRQKYCGECRESVRKTKEKQRQKERRLGNAIKRTHLG